MPQISAWQAPSLQPGVPFASQQSVTGHSPQSLGQLPQVSPASHAPSPQSPPPWQAGQACIAISAQSSSHSWSQQKESCSQTDASQPPSSQPALPFGSQQSPFGQGQSPGQVSQVSFGSQVSSPQTPVHSPQSAGQVSQFSSGSQLPSGQTPGHSPQSVGHVPQSSPSSHIPSPHTGPAH